MSKIINVSKNDRTAFFSTVICGLAIHMYKLTNTLPNGDSLYNFYHTQNIVSSGRWFLAVACAPSSFFDLPWIEGLFSILYIALTAAIIVRLFDIRNRAVIAICGCLLVSLPGVTETFFYGFTSDGYFLAMLFSALAVYLSTRESKKAILLPLSALLVCLSCGIYQSYVSFALILALLYFIFRAFDDKYTARSAWRFVGEQAIVFSSAMLLYYIIWRICMTLQGAVATDYLGISEIGLSGYTPKQAAHAFSGCIKNIKLALIDFSRGQKPTLYSVLNMIFMLFLVAGISAAAIKTKLWRRKMPFIMTIAALICIIPFSCIWIFVSPDMVYRPMMLTCLGLVPIFTAVIFDRYAPARIGKVLTVFLAVMMINNGLIANISYLYMEKCYERSYATALEMTTRMHMMADDDEISRIAVVGAGSRSAATALGADEPSARARVLTSHLQSDLLSDKYRVYYFFSNILGVEFPFTSEEGCAALENDDAVRAMGVWPARDSMVLRDGVLIIKIGECP